MSGYNDLVKGRAGASGCFLIVFRERNLVAVFTPGMRVLCRNAEWLLTQVKPASDLYDERVVHCLGTGELTRCYDPALLTQVDRLENYKVAYRVFSERSGLDNKGIADAG